MFYISANYFVTNMRLVLPIVALISNNKFEYFWQLDWLLILITLINICSSYKMPLEKKQIKFIIHNYNWYLQPIWNDFYVFHLGRCLENKTNSCINTLKIFVAIEIFLHFGYSIQEKGILFWWKIHEWYLEIYAIAFNELVRFICFYGY